MTMMPMTTSDLRHQFCGGTGSNDGRLPTRARSGLAALILPALPSNRHGSPIMIQVCVQSIAARTIETAWIDQESKGVTRIARKGSKATDCMEKGSNTLRAE